MQLIRDGLSFCEGSGRAPATESVEQDGEDGTRARLSW